MLVSFARIEHAVARRILYSPQAELGHAVFSVALTVSIALSAFFIRLNLASAISILLLATVTISMRWGVVQGTVVSLSAVACLDYLFTQPLFKFSIYSRENWIALATFQITALMVSRLSWKERLHAQEQQYQRQGIGKLYQLSNAILLVDSRTSELEQLGALMREFFSIGSVDLWAAEESRSSTSVPAAKNDSNPAYEVFERGKDLDNVEQGWSRRVLRMGAAPIGGMVLHDWEVDPALADAMGSLIAVAIERTRSAEKENRAKAARNTEQLRTAVLDALAHGFKTPLTAIQTASSGLLAIGRLGQTQTELVEIIDQEVSMLANLTTRLLKTAALDASEIRVRLSSVSIMTVINAIVADQSTEIRNRIHISAPSSLLDIHADAQILGLAIAQLIDNASKYSRVGTGIELSLQQDQTKTVVAVSNEAEPISGEDLKRIFDRYCRGPQAGRGPTGTGLGLSIVKKIAEAHGGIAGAACKGNTITISMSLPGGIRPNDG